MKKLFFTILIFCLGSKISLACDLTFVNFGDKPDKFLENQFALPIKDDFNGETVKNARVFFDGRKLAENDVGLFDGIKIYPDGTIFSTGPGGVLIIAENGTHLGTIKTVERTANCTFDSNYKYLYMTSDMYLTRVKLKTN